MTLLDKLKKAYDKHGNIIIGVDFDDTIFALHTNDEDLCKNIRATLRECKSYSTICLYTVADNQSLKYKIELMKMWGIEPDYVNASPIKLGNGDKPYFNILLDDKAGLLEAYKTLLNFNQTL